MKMTEAGNALVKIAKVVEKNQPVSVCVHVLVYVCVYARTCVCVCVRARTCVCLSVCMSLCVCTM